MARLALVVRPNGSALLVTAEPFSAEALEPVRQALDDWIEGRYQVGVLADTELVRIHELEVDLEARLIRRAPAEIA